MFEDRLNNFWVIKFKEYCWKKVYAIRRRLMFSSYSFECVG